MSHRLPVADIQFISDFAAFCRTKGDERYRPDLVGECALAQFGYPNEIGKNVPWSAYKMAIGCNDDGSDVEPFYKFTFSALADRLEALIADAPAIAKATGA